MSAAEVTRCTPRLTLRPWRAQDRDPFAQINADPQVMAYFPATLSRAQSDAFADSICERMTTNGWGFFAVEINDLIPFIGFVDLNIPKYSLPFSPCVEIAW
ncbi:MAG: RimJ/RimL family protein N-acetyltransferase [Gammaproteobacteria bacterium]|jgi:RimJ/RimL family protein N-acetyltransferase